MDNTIIQQGYFTSTGANVTLKLRSDVDWIKTYNLTNIAAATQWDAVSNYWQREMTSNDCVAWYHGAATQATYMSTCAVGWNGAVYPGFTLIDSSAQTLGAAIAVTAGTNATQPVYSTGTTTGLSTGAIVRVTGSAHTDINGLDFSVDTVVAATSFRLANTLATAPGAIAGANGYWRLVAHNLDEYKIFHPATRNIANITQAASAVVTTMVDHGYVAGQRVKFSVPHVVYGMTQLDGLVGTITAVTTNTFTVDINTTTFTAFAYPTIANVTAYGAFTNAQVIPFGETASDTYANKLDDAVYNKAFLGIILGAGAGSPAGETGDVIKWVAGKSFATNL